MYLSLSLSLSLSLCLLHFNETWIFLYRFSKQSDFINVRLVGAMLFHAGGRSDVRELKVAFRNYAKVPYMNITDT